MNDDYVKGLAFVMEGPTEKVFYLSFVNWLATVLNCKLEKIDLQDSGDTAYRWVNESGEFLIRINVVGTITQITNSADWFRNTCAKKYKIPWNVYLCYDTDNSMNDISKFFQGDWELLRKKLRESRAKEVVDLAAKADIEDVMLCDLPNICRFLNIEQPQSLTGKKGKSKMKALYRSCGKTYHEGERAADMINELDFEVIMNKGPIPLNILKKELI